MSLIPHSLFLLPILGIVTASITVRASRGCQSRG